MSTTETPDAGPRLELRRVLPVPPELMSKLNDHARRAHPDSFRAMTPEMLKAVEQKVAQFTRTV